MISAGVLARLFLKAAPNPEQYNLSKCLRQSSARGRREGFPQMGVPTIICGCVRKVFQHLLFYKNGFEHQQKVKPNRTKTRFLKKFDIRREPKGSQREPKGSQREPKGSQRSRKSSSFFH